MHATFEGTAEGVRNEMRAFLGLDASSSPSPAPKAAKVAKETVATAPTAAEARATPATQTVAAGAAAPATGPITLDNVRDLVPLVAAKQGRPKAMELLAKYGAKKGNEVKEADWAKFIEDAKALLV